MAEEINTPGLCRDRFAGPPRAGKAARLFVVDQAMTEKNAPGRSVSVPFRKFFLGYQKFSRSLCRTFPQKQYRVEWVNTRAGDIQVLPVLLVNDQCRYPCQKKDNDNPGDEDHYPRVKSQRDHTGDYPSGSEYPGGVAVTRPAGRRSAISRSAFLARSATVPGSSCGEKSTIISR